jgi:hypothetical protein
MSVSFFSFCRVLKKIIVPLVQIDISLLADQVRVSATDTLDLGQGVHDLLLSVNIGVEETENLPDVSKTA